MAGKVYEVAFQIAGEVSSKFRSSFKNAAMTTESLGQRVRDLNRQLGDVRNLQKMEAAVEASSRAFQDAQRNVAEIRQKLAAIGPTTQEAQAEFRRISGALGAATRDFQKAQARVKELKDQIAATDAPTDEMRESLRRAEAESERLRESVKRNSDALEEARRQSEGMTQSREELVRQEKAAQAAVERAKQAFQRDAQALGEARIKTGNLSTSTAELTRREKELSEAAEKAAANMKKIAEINGKIEKMNDRISKMESVRAGAAARMAVGSAAVGIALKATVGPYIEVEDAMLDVAKVTDFTDDGLKQFDAQIAHLTKTIPQTHGELLQLAAAGATAGIEQENLVGFTENAAKMQVAYGISAAEAGEMMGKWKSGMGLTMEQTYALADATNALADTNAAEAAQIGDVLKRYGALGKMAGITETQLAAMAATVIGSGRSSEEATTGIKAFMNALGKGKSMSKAQMDAFMGVGIDPEQIQKDLIKDGPKAIMGALQTIRDRVPPEMMNEYLGVMFGQEAAGAIGPMLGNLELLQTNFDKVADKANYASSVENEFNNRNKATSAQLQLAKNALNESAIALGQELAPYILEAAKAASAFLQKLTDWIKENPELTKQIIKIGGSIALGTIALNGLMFGVTSVIGPFLKLGKGILLLKKGFVFLRGAKGAGGAPGMFARMKGALVKLSGAFKSFGTTAVGAFKKIGPFMKATGGKLAGMAAKVGPAMSNIGGKISALWGKVGPVAANIGGKISALWGKAGPVVMRLGGAIKTFGSVAGGAFLKLGGAIKAFGGAAIAIIKAVGVACMTNPIILIIAAIIAAVALAVYLIIKYWDQIKAAWQVCVDAFAAGLAYWADAFSSAWEWIKSGWNALVAWFSSAWDAFSSWFGDVWNSLVDTLGGVWDAITGAASAAWEGIKGIVSGVIDWIASKLEWVSEKIDAVKNVGSNIVNGAKNIGSSVVSGIANFVGLASGGVATGPTLALIGEGGESEAVVPLSKLESMIGGGSDGGVVVNFAPSITVSGGGDAYAGVSRALAEGQANLKRELEKLLANQRRVAYN